MKILKNIISNIVSVSLLCSTPTLHAQQTAELHIGDNIPDIKYGMWLQGVPVKSIKDNKIYVVEFWATWCGACIMAMPHMSELSEKYKGKAIFLGCNMDIYENTHGKTYQSAMPNILRFMKSEMNHMTYPVFVDNEDRYIEKNWLQPVGDEGLPSTFVVKNGKLIWLGAPAELDNVIDSLIDGTYNMAAFKSRDEQRRIQRTKAKSIAKPLDDAISSGDYSTALKIVNQRIATAPEISLKMRKFQILSDGFGEKQAMDYLIELKEKHDPSAFEVARTLPSKSGLSKELYTVAIEILESYSSKYDAVNRIATAKMRIGDPAGAISEEQKAITLIQASIAKETNTGVTVVLQKSLSNYQEKLNDYEKAVK